MKGKKWILSTKFNGEPSPSNFRLLEEDVDENLKDEVICEALYLSVDPYMRFFAIEVGNVINGEQVAKMTAYFGVLNVLKVKARETFVVTSAAGAVGSVAGQIAKLKGCKVIGFTGSNDKCDLIKGYGFDYAFNYKEVTIQEALSEAAPEGVDCYFDNVGGEFTNNILSFMNMNGRIAICGSMSTYTVDENQPTGPLPYHAMLKKALKVHAFHVYSYNAEWPAGLNEMIQWVKEGKIKYQETITDGFDNMVDAFIGLFKGTNVGKAIVKC